MICPNCGKQNVDDVKFCANCGAAFQPDPQPVPQQASVNQQPVQLVTAVQSPNKNNSISDEEKARRKRKGTILGIISMAILFGMSAIVIPLELTRVLDEYMLFGVAIALVYVAAVIAAYVLMIISLVKYRSTLPKVMIWIYGIILVVTVIYGVYFMVSASIDCGNDCVECIHHF